jgi:hypothetical protein
VNGTWLVATNTVCTLLGLFYTAEGETGSPPGCPSTTTATAVPAGSTSSTGPASGSDASAPGASATTTLGGGSPATASPTTRAGTGTANGPAATSDPSTKPDPVVEANSGSLAFTGLGMVAQWLAIVGGALMILGFTLLGIADTPRRVMYRLATLTPTRRRRSPPRGQENGDSAGGDPSRTATSERLWISGW